LLRKYGKKKMGCQETIPLKAAIDKGFWKEYIFPRNDQPLIWAHFAMPHTWDRKHRIGLVPPLLVGFFFCFNAGASARASDAVEKAGDGINGTKYYQSI
jgi:hypothetical protein